MRPDTLNHQDTSFTVNLGLNTAACVRFINTFWFYIYYMLLISYMALTCEVIQAFVPVLFTSRLLQDRVAGVTQQQQQDISEKWSGRTERRKGKESSLKRPGGSEEEEEEEMKTLVKKKTCMWGIKKKCQKEGQRQGSGGRWNSSWTTWYVFILLAIYSITAAQ